MTKTLWSVRSIFAATVAVFLAAGVPAAEAGVQSCKVRIGKGGELLIDASNIAGVPSWGFAVDTVDAPFFNAGTCVSAGRARKCAIGDPGTEAGRTLPTDCVLYVGDESGDPPCQAVLARDCVNVALLADGSVPINQDRALAGGVTPSDTPGFPVTLDRPGSYRLTGNLDLTGQPDAANLTAIEVEAGPVTIDLGGFVIEGPTTCDMDSLPACSPAGSGVGILATSLQVTVRNGTIDGMGRFGVELTLGECERLEGLRITNTQVAIVGPQQVDASGCTILGNSIDRVGDGISCFGCIIRDNRISNSRSFGIAAGVGSTIVGNNVENSGASGLVAGRNSLVKDNVVTGSVDYGIVAHQGSTVVNNSCGDNDTNGIRVTCPSAVIGNTSANNGASGILFFGSGCVDSLNAP